MLKNGLKYVFCVFITVQTVSHIRKIAVTTSNQKLIAKVSEYPRAECRETCQSGVSLVCATNHFVEACGTPSRDVERSKLLVGQK